MTEDELNAEIEAAAARDRAPISRQRDSRPAFQMLPAAPESEMGLLSSLFMAPEYVFKIVEAYGGAEHWFHAPANRILFQTASELYEAGKPIDTLLILDTLGKAGTLDAVGGGKYVSEISTYLPTAANAQHYAEVCEEKGLLREIIQQCNTAAQEAYAAEFDAKEIVEKLEQSATRLALRGHKKRAGTIKDVVREVVERCTSGNLRETWGIPTGLPALDAVIRGMGKGQMIAIGGGTSSGKTSLAANILYSCCVKGKEPALVLSLEMNRSEFVEVLLQIGSGVSVDNLTSGNCDLLERQKVTQVASLIAQAPLTIRDERDLSIVQARSIARSAKPRIIVIDYAQLMTGGKNRYERGDMEIAEISRGAKKMAGELDATVILLTQLNDDGKVAGSRAIAKDADKLLIVKDGANADEKIVQVCKQRRGPKEELAFRWIGPIQKFLSKPI